MPGLEVKILPALSDNYIFALKNERNDIVIIDPGEADPVIRYMESLSAKITEIWITHHHHDHVGGVKELKEKYSCKVYCSKHDLSRLDFADHGLAEEDVLDTLSVPCKVLEVPGHSLGHIAYFFPHQKLLFSGDAIFSLGCGRILEGNPQMTFNSLKKIESLPENTQIYFAHEYTKKNCKFAQSVDPKNLDLKDFEKEIDEKLKKNLYTVPTTLSLEKKLNPFLRASSKGIKQELNMLNKEELEVFSRLRELRNSF